MNRGANAISGPAETAGRGVTAMRAVPFARLRTMLMAAALVLIVAVPARAQNTLSALQTDVDRIANGARPAVVTVVAQRTLMQRRSARGALERHVLTRIGSGVTVSESEILTTASVVLAAEHLRIRTVNGLEAAATLVAMDPIFNVALLRVADLRLSPLTFASGPALGPGDWVITLGTSYRGQWTQSVGNVAFRERDPRFSMLQLTNVVYPGNSGGAALNSRGELVGIVQGDLGAPDLGGSSDLDRRPGGASFILPVESLRPVYESMRKLGRLPYGWLGVATRVAEVESDTQAGLRVPLGAMVESVVPGGPADRVGLKRGDLIVAFENERVEFPEQLARWVAASRPGTSVHLVWARNEVERSGRAALVESPDAAPTWAMNFSAPAAPVSNPRIAEIERQIQRLNRELEQLKTQPAPTPR
jgi:S1-C subfamily serine protease